MKRMEQILGYISDFDGQQMTIIAPYDNAFILTHKQITQVEIRLDDGRSISAVQRKKIFATINDIAKWSGHEPEYIRQQLTWDFCSEYGCDWFSLSTVDMTTAKEFINYLIEFCFRFDIPTMDTLLNRTEDIGRYIYLCLMYRRCFDCNKPHCQVHHVDVVGLGRDRDTINHLGLAALPVCVNLHKEIHDIGDAVFMEKYHVQPVKLDEFLCKRLKLHYK